MLLFVENNKEFYTLLKEKFKGEDNLFIVLGSAGNIVQYLVEYDIPSVDYVVFGSSRHFDRLEYLQRELADYVHWYNHIRIHGTLNYQSPIQYKLEHLKKVV